MSVKCKHGIRDTETNLPYCRHCDDEGKSELAAPAEPLDKQKMKTTKEKLTEAEQSADLLLQTIAAAHKDTHGALEMMLYDMMNAVSGIRGRLARLAKEEQE